MKKSNAQLNWYRIRTGVMASDNTAGNNGAFKIPFNNGGAIFCIASDGLGWDHVSVRVERPDGSSCIPTWATMCFVKNLFWSEDEVVVQYHPAKSDCINVHECVLHLWAPQGVTLPMPPLIMV